MVALSEPDARAVRCPALFKKGGSPFFVRRHKLPGSSTGMAVLPDAQY